MPAAPLDAAGRALEREGQVRPTTRPRTPMEARWPGRLRAIVFAATLVPTVALIGTPHAWAQAQEAAEAAEAEETTEIVEAGRPSALAQFTTGVENREPIDQVTFVSNETRTIYFFSDLRELTGRRITHRWIHDGETMAEVGFDVGGPRWRVWSSKDLLEDWLGDWTVEIVTDEGEVVAAETFTYSAPGG